MSIQNIIQELESIEEYQYSLAYDAQIILEDIMTILEEAYPEVKKVLDHKLEGLDNLLDELQEE